MNQAREEVEVPGALPGQGSHPGEQVGVPVGAKAKWGVEDTWGGCCLWDSGKLGAAHCTWGGKGFSSA